MAIVATVTWQQVGRRLADLPRRLFIVEAGAGGAIQSAASAAPGASRWFAGGLSCYHDSVKTGLLRLSPQTLRDHGAVSPVTVAELASGALAISDTDLVLAESGVYGPGGGSPEKPIGCVYLAIGQRNGAVAGRKLVLQGERTALRQTVAAQAAQFLWQRLDELNLK